ncbi:MAG: electron transfer flavoprotein subunit alpha/FixB family protein [Candidatus Zhuqueibacterota bacterium]
MSKPVFVVTEQRNGVFRNVSFEAVSQGRRLADQMGSELVAVVLGSGIDGISQIPGFYGADKVLVGDSPLFGKYNADAFTKAIVDAVKSVDPEIIMLPATSMGKDLAPRLAARLDVALATDCTRLSLENGKLHALRPMFAGKVLASHELLASPQLVSIRPNVFRASSPDNSRTAVVEKLTITTSPSELKAVVKEIISGAGGKIDLTEASIIVSGGRGMKGPENFAILEELANLLGAAVGASRSAVDSGWRPHADQVGQTGKTVSPDLYIACGISGAIQHLAGMSSSKYIVAINKDPEAPIFQRADYGIVGDLFDVVPALTQELKKIVDK